MKQNYIFKTQKSSREKKWYYFTFFPISSLYGLMEDRWSLICFHSQSVASDLVEIYKENLTYKDMKLEKGVF